MFGDHAGRIETGKMSTTGKVRLAGHRHPQVHHHAVILREHALDVVAVARVVALQPVEEIADAAEAIGGLGCAGCTG